MKPLYADIILPLPLADHFTYLIPNELERDVAVGKRVIVQFGAKKYYSGLIKSIHSNKPEFDEIKSVETVLDEAPVIMPQQLEFWTWMAGYYMCTLGEVMKAALPSGLKLESQTKVIFNPEFEAKNVFTEAEDVVYRLMSDQKVATIGDVNRALASNSGLRVIKSLLQKGAISVEEQLKNSYKPKTESVVKLAPPFRSEAALHKALNLTKSAPKQHQALEYFIAECHEQHDDYSIEIPKRRLETIVSAASLKALVDKGIFTIEQRRVERLEDGVNAMRDLYALNPYQQKAYEEINSAFETTSTILLHGVTSSGKTEIYIRLIEDCIKQGKQVLYLLPEIGLTTQIIQRLKKVFGKKVGVYHSKFNDQERVEIWNKVLNYEKNQEDSYQVVLGARSAVFLPFSNLGLIVIDEEHESSYKQFDPAPRYHARDSAMVISHMAKAKTLLGTATPSIESYYNALTGKFKLVDLKHRHGNMSLPTICVADLREAYRKKQMKGHFTPELHQEIEMALANGEQVILFQNRRGFSSFVQCKSCGWIPKCTDCDVSLTYHKRNGTLVCHYCGHAEYMPQKCGSCANEQIDTKGFGTEKIEEEISEVFPGARVARMDLDSTRKKNAFERLIQKFENQELDILVGTQMVTKGLDFANVSTVGILNADNMLNFPDFRSFERSFQLLSQVSGRAGRKNKQGKVIIQTSSPDHVVINDVINNSYLNLFNTQTRERKMFKYPPFYRLITITVKHKNNKQLDVAARQLAVHLRHVFGDRVLGPEYPVITRVQLWYQKIIWLKVEKQFAPSVVKKHILEKISFVRNLPGNSSLNVVADVDPQ